VELLLNAGAEIDFRTNYDSVISQSAVDITLQKGYADILALLVERGAKFYALDQALLLALDQDHIKLADIMLRAGANINAKCNNYGRLLQKAIIKGSKKMVRLFIRHGAEINDLVPKTSIGGNCALMAAISSGKASEVRYLLKHGAMLKQAQGVFGNALQSAAHFGKLDVVHAILESAALDVNETDGSPLTPLCMAMRYHWRVLKKEVEDSECDHAGVMRLLLEKGAKLSDEDVKLWYDRENGIPSKLLDTLRSEKQQQQQ
jgi:ankyrin repeat protein